MPVLPFLEDREEDIKILVKLCAEKERNLFILILE